MNFDKDHKIQLENISKKYKKNMIKERRKIIFESYTSDSIDSLFPSYDNYINQFNYDFLEKLFLIFENAIKFEAKYRHDKKNMKNGNVTVTSFSESIQKMFYSPSTQWIFVHGRYHKDAEYNEYIFSSIEDRNIVNSSQIFNNPHLYIYVQDKISFNALINNEIQIVTCSLTDFLLDNIALVKEVGILDIISNFMEEAKTIPKLSLEKLYNLDSSVIIETLIHRIYKNYDYNSQELVKLSKYIMKSSNKDKIARMLFSYNFTMNKLNCVEDLNSFFDFSFVAVSLFKLVEVIFQEILYNKFNDKITYYNNDGIIRYINPKNQNITLGQMGYIFKSNDAIVLKYFTNKQDIVVKLDELFEKWVSKSRNGYLHKHVIDDQNKLKESIGDSLKIIIMLILLFEN